MTNEWYDVVYLGFSRIFVTGGYGDEVIEVELNDIQREKLFDYNEQKKIAEWLFLKELINES